MASASVLAFGQTVIFARLLAPVQFGYYSAALALTSVGTFLQFGFLSGLGRELPIAIGAQEQDRANRLIAAATVAVTTVAGTGLLLWLTALTLSGVGDDQLRVAIALGGVMSVSSLLANLALVRLRSERDIFGFAVLLFVQRSALLIVGAAAAHVQGFVAVLFTAVALDIAVFFSATKFRLATVSYRMFGRSEIVELMKSGLPIMAGSALYSVQLSADKIFYLTVATPEQMGLYQIASLPIIAGSSLSSIIGQYVYPKWLLEFGATRDIAALFKASATFSIIAIGIMLALFPVVHAAAGVIFEWFLPDYRTAISTLDVLYVGAVFLTANVAGASIYAANRPILIVISSGVVLLVTVPAFEFASRHTTNMTWFATVSSLGIAAEYLLRTWLARQCVRNSQIAVVPAMPMQHD